MESLLLESAIRAVLVAAGTALILRVFGITAAAVRHRAWTGVVLLMLVLPLWAAIGPNVGLPILEPGPIGSGVADDPSLPGISDAAVVTHLVQPAAPIPWRAFLLILYAAGALILLGRLALGTLRARRLIRSAAIDEDYLTSDACAAPLTVGWLHPVILLPRDWKLWPKAQLDAVLTHERQHARRYDPLVQWFALVNRAIFWFHPLSWWLERRLAALAEGACDAAVLAAGHTPQDYSEYLLDLARSTMRQGKRFSIAGMAMPGRNLTHRIRTILEGGPMQSISRSRLTCVVVLCVLTSAVFAAATLEPRQSEAAIGESQKLLDLLPAEVLHHETGKVVAVMSFLESQELGEQSMEWMVRLLEPGVGIKPLGGWPNAASSCAACHDSTNSSGLADALGLTVDQRFKLDRTMEYHRQNIKQSQEQLEKEESQLGALLEADPTDRGAILAQLDRVLQVRGEADRKNAAMALEMRDYLTHAQWMKLNQVGPLAHGSAGWIEKKIAIEAPGEPGQTRQ
jgi:Spy/CpxP family protein refolding chaperone